METVKQILGSQGVQQFEDLDLNERYEVDGGETYMDLTIERVSDSELSVAHYFTQRMDLMRDPEVVFRIDEYREVPHGWVPVEYRQDPGVYEADQDGLGYDVQRFVDQWDSNLMNQGFVDRAEAGQVKHSE